MPLTKVFAANFKACICSEQDIPFSILTIFLRSRERDRNAVLFLDRINRIGERAGSCAEGGLRQNQIPSMSQNSAGLTTKSSGEISADVLVVGYERNFLDHGLAYHYTIKRIVVDRRNCTQRDEVLGRD